MKKIRESIHYRRAYKRGQRLSTPDIIDWLDTYGSEAARLLNQHRQQPDPTMLQQAHEAHITALALLETLRTRATQ